MDLLAVIELLVIDTSASWIRMFIALGISVVLAFVIGILAATSRKAERVILPVVDVLQTLPILAFFPFAIVIFVYVLPGQIWVGINIAVIFLIVTSMLWNIIFGVYEAVRTIPVEFFEVTELYHFDFWTRLKKLYIPACFPRVVEQSILSWAIGLFYLVTSEIFSTGTANYKVTYGIGTGLVQFAAVPQDYFIAIVVFIIFVVATRLLFFKPLEDYATRYTKSQAKLARPLYGQMVSNWISKGLRSRYIKEIHHATKDIRIVKHPNRHLMLPKVEPKNRTRLYTAVALAAAAIAIYIVVSNNVLLVEEYQILPALAASFARVWLAFLVISLITVPVCVYLVFIAKNSNRYLMFFQVLASIPATILLPLIVQALSASPDPGEVVAFTIFVLSGVWYIIFSVVASTRTMSPTIFEVKKLFGVKGIQAWKEIYLKAIMPGFITGAVTAIAAEWNASIVAEYFTATGITGSHITTQVGVGIGKLLDMALASPNGLGLMELALLNLVVMIILINTFVWKKAYRRVTKVYG